MTVIMFMKNIARKGVPFKRERLECNADMSN